MYQGVSVYITSAGVPIKLGSNDKINIYNKIDLQLYPNGALYGFTKNGVSYVAIQEQVYTPGAITIPPPEFTQFYEVEIVNGKKIVRYDKPTYQFKEEELPKPDANGTIRAVRIKQVKDENGNCTLVKELVDYKPDMSRRANESAKANYNIEYGPAVPNTSTSTPMQCTGDNGTTSQLSKQLTLDQYVIAEGIPLFEFLRDRMHSSVKMYLYDCKTGNTNYTISNVGIRVISGADQQAETNKFQNGTFTAGDADIAIGACIENGEWKYDVKLNYTNLGAPHPKVAPYQSQVLAEIKKQADAEVAGLKAAGRKRDAEEYVVENNERFYKASMGLLEALAVFYDIGRHFYTDAKMPEFIWDGGNRSNGIDANAQKEYNKSPIKIPSLPAGATDQLVDEATGIVQLVQTGYEFFRHPKKSFDAVWQGIKNLNGEKIKQLFTAVTGIDNYTAGGHRAWYQGGRHGVQVAMAVISQIKNLGKGVDIIKETGPNITELQKFIPDGIPNHPASDVFRNAIDNKLAVRKIDEDKILTSNKRNNERQVVAVERNGDDVKVYTAKEADLTDPRTGHTYTEDEIFESAKDFDKPKVTSVVNGRTKVEIEAGTTRSWTKELNNPKPNTDYHIKNSGPTPHKYSTDGQGRVVQVEAELTLNERARNGHQQTVKCKVSKDGLPDDQGGHLIGSQFDGAGEQINLVPMTSDLNLSKWATMENNWRNLLSQTPPKKVKIEIEIIYDPANPLSKRPSGFKVKEFVDGQQVLPVKQFIN